MDLFIFWWNVAGCLSPNCPYPIQLDHQQVTSELVRLAPATGIIALTEYTPGLIPAPQLTAIAGTRKQIFVPYNSEGSAGILYLFPEAYELVIGPRLPWWPSDAPDRGASFEREWRERFPIESPLWERRFVMFRNDKVEVIPMHFCQPWSAMTDGKGLWAKIKAGWNIWRGGPNPHDHQLNAFLRELDALPRDPKIERLVVGDFNVPTEIARVFGRRFFKPRLVQELERRLTRLVLTPHTFPNPASGWPGQSMQLDQAYSSHGGVRVRVLDGEGADHFPLLVIPGRCSDFLME